MCCCSCCMRRRSKSTASAHSVASESSARSRRVTSSEHMGLLWEHRSVIVVLLLLPFTVWRQWATGRMGLRGQRVHADHGIPQRTLSAFVALHNYSAADGETAFCLGLHRLDDDELTALTTSMQFRMRQHCQLPWRGLPYVAEAVQAGTLTLYDHRLPHYGTQNTGATDRVLLNMNIAASAGAIQQEEYETTLGGRRAGAEILAWQRELIPGDAWAVTERNANWRPSWEGLVRARQSLNTSTGKLAITEDRTNGQGGQQLSSHMRRQLGLDPPRSSWEVVPITPESLQEEHTETNQESCGAAS